MELDLSMRISTVHPSKRIARFILFLNSSFKLLQFVMRGHARAARGQAEGRGEARYTLKGAQWSSSESKVCFEVDFVEG